MVLLTASGIGFALIAFTMYYHITQYASQSAAPVLLQAWAHHNMLLCGNIKLLHSAHALSVPSRTCTAAQQHVS